MLFPDSELESATRLAVFSDFYQRISSMRHGPTANRCLIRPPAPELLQKAVYRLGCTGLEWVSDQEADFLQFLHESFHQLIDTGMLSRYADTVPWDPIRQTALDKCETVSEVADRFLYSIQFPMVGKTGRQLTVRLQRPERLLGAVALLINPRDKRAEELVGVQVEIPGTGGGIPVIASDLADPESGTGLRILNPSQEPELAYLAEEHELEFMEIIGANGRVVDEIESYAGLDWITLRERLVADLEALERIEIEEQKDAPRRLARASGTELLRRRSTEWFLDLRKPSRDAQESLQESNLKIVPERLAIEAQEALQEPATWCLSRNPPPDSGKHREIPAHPLPLRECSDCQTIQSDRLTTCARCGSSQLASAQQQFDPAFVSACWRLYATQNADWTGWILPVESGRMLGRMLALARALQLPVFPIFIVGFGDADKEEDELGSAEREADWDAEMNSTGADVWRRLCLARGDPVTREAASDQLQQIRQTVPEFKKILRDNQIESCADSLPEGTNLSADDMVLIFRTSACLERCETELRRGRIDAWVQRLYQCLLQDILPLAQPENRLLRAESAPVLAWSLHRIFRLLACVQPFVAEEAWEQLCLPGTPWLHGLPEALEEDALAELGIDDTVINYGEAKREIILKAGQLRKEHGLQKNSLQDFFIVPGKGQHVLPLEKDLPHLTRQLSARRLKIDANVDLAKTSEHPSVSGKLGTLYLLRQEKIDVQAETSRLLKQEGKLTRELISLSKKLENKDFRNKAAKDIVAEHKMRQIEMRQELKSLRKRLEDLEGQE